MMQTSSRPALTKYTHSQTLKDSATQLLIKYKSGPLVTQLKFSCVAKSVLLRPRLIWLDRDAECGHGVKRWEV